jgi:hypothetical protein
MSYVSSPLERVSARERQAPYAAIAQRPVLAGGSVAFVAAVSLLLTALGILWPGAILLTIIFLMAAHAAMLATIELHALVSSTDRGLRSWLRLTGAATLIVGVPALLLLNGTLALAPVVVGAWCATRARTAVVFAASAACLTLGLLLLTSFGVQSVHPLTFVAIQAVSTGVSLIARSAPPASAAPTEARWHRGLWRA